MTLMNTHWLTYAYIGIHTLQTCIYFAGSPSCPPNKGYSPVDVRSPGAHIGHIHPNMPKFQILVNTSTNIYVLKFKLNNQ